MAAPFLDNICGSVTASPGTGAFTPTAAYTGCLAWTAVPSGQYCYRADEGGSWEIGYGVWNGATITRAVLLSSNANALVSFGTGVIISLTTGADIIQPHMGGENWGMLLAKPGSTTFDAIGLAAPTITGTVTTPALATTNTSTRRKKVQIASATTANAVAGLSYALGAGHGLYWSTDAADVGFELSCRFGWSGVPAAHRILIGMSNAALAAAATEPSTVNNHVALVKDSTDTNFQFSRRSGTTTTKVNLGIAPAAGMMYELTIYKNPGNQELVCLFMPLDGTTLPVVTRIAAGAANLPANNTELLPILMSGLTATTGTASSLLFQHLHRRELA